MSITLCEVFDYLDTHPVGSHSGSFESYLEMIHDAYAEVPHLL